MKCLIIIILFVMGCVACKKNDITPPVIPPVKNYFSFLNATEWVGVDDGKRSQYARPADLIFRSDSTVTIYSIFNFSIDGGVNIKMADSTNGKILKIDSMPGGSTHIMVHFPDLGGDQVITITGRKTLTMSSANFNDLSFNARSYNLELFSSAVVSLNGTTWSGESVNANDPPNRYYYCPDLSAVTFSSIKDNTKVTYTKNGHIIQEHTGAEIGILQVSYQQIGARIYLFGYDEDYSFDMDIALKTGNYTDYIQGRMVKYFGILLPSGNRILVDARSANARLPNYTQTVDRYGPKGVTPVIMKL